MLPLPENIFPLATATNPFPFAETMVSRSRSLLVPPPPLLHPVTMVNEIRIRPARMNSLLDIAKASVRENHQLHG
jgi:hypothetical protein